MTSTTAPPSMGGGRLTDPALSAALRTLELSVRRRLDGILQGVHLGLLPGPGSEAGEARLYLPGDDVRRMDWNVTARTTEPHVRQTIADRELETWLVIDLSASLDVASGACSKRDLAVAAAAALIILTQQDGNRVGAVISDGASRRLVPARSGRRHAEALLRTVATTPAAGRAEPHDLARAVEAVRPAQRRRGLTAIVSDFLGDTTWERPVRGVAGRQDVLGVRLVDPHDVDVPAAGRALLRDPETGRTAEFDLTDELREDYRSAAARHDASVEHSLRRAGAPLMRLHTDGDWIMEIIRFVTARRAHAPAAPSRVR